MPVSSAAKKALRHSLKKKVQHQRIETVLKKTLHLYRQRGGNLNKVYSAIDKARQGGLFNRGKANRLKARWAVLTAVGSGKKEKKST